jgi:hypothetical protein
MRSFLFVIATTHSETTRAKGNARYRFIEVLHDEESQSTQADGHAD